MPRSSGRWRESIDWHPVPSKISHPIVLPLAGDVNGFNTSLQLTSLPTPLPRYASFSVLVGVVWDMAEPGDGIAAGASGHGRLRASHADREQVIGVLKAAFVQGRLAKNEFDLRVSQAFASRTYADLAAVTADLPAGLAAPPPPRPTRAQSEGWVRRPGLVLAVGTVAYAAVWPVALAFPASGPGPDQDPPGLGPLVGVTFFYMIFLLVVGAMLVDAWQWKRSARQLPPGRAPGAGGHAYPRPPSPDPGRQLPPGHSGHRHTAECQWRRSQRPVRAGQPLLET